MGKMVDALRRAEQERKQARQRQRPDESALAVATPTPPAAVAAPAPPMQASSAAHDHVASVASPSPEVRPAPQVAPSPPVPPPPVPQVLIPNVEASQVPTQQAVAVAQPDPIPNAPAAPGPGHHTGHGALDPYLVAYYDRQDEASEQYRALRTSILAQNPTGQPRSLVFTSSSPREGKTVTTLNLAITIADSGEHRVLVVDGDLRFGRVAEMLGVAPRPGLTDLLADEAAIDAVVQSTLIENLDVVAAGRAIANPTELVASSHARQLFGLFKSRYDVVLVDTPPLSYTDASVIASYCDGAYLAVKMGDTHRHKADHAIGLIESAGGRVLGCVMTNLRYYIPGYLYHRT